MTGIVKVKELKAHYDWLAVYCHLKGNSNELETNYARVKFPKIAGFAKSIIWTHSCIETLVT